MDCVFGLLKGDALAQLKTVDGDWMHCCVTSPPYYRQRDYGHPGQLGQEKTPEEFVQKLASVFDEVRRILNEDGSLWVNIDDSYHNQQLLGVPWMLAFELKRRGWFLRCDNIWFKTSTRPEAVANRCSRNHEYLFHLTKKPSGYYFDQDAVREPHDNPWVLDCLRKFAERPLTKITTNLFNKEERHSKGQRGISRAQFGASMNPKGKNKRSMWFQKYQAMKPNLTPQRALEVLSGMAEFGWWDVVVPEEAVPALYANDFEPLSTAMLSVVVSSTNKLRKAHYAPFPEHLIVPCLRATCPIDGAVLDPFCGSGTTGLASLANDRNFIGIELVEASFGLAKERLENWKKPT